MKQFQGGHDEKWGGVKINIDRNYLDLHSDPPPPRRRRATATAPRSTRPTTRGSSHRPGATTPNPAQVTALKCLLKEQGVFHGRRQGVLDQRLTKSVKHWQRQVGLHRTAMFSRSAWMTLLSAGPTPVLNLGSSGEDVRRVQRALNAASAQYKLPISGTLDPVTQAAVVAWQAKNGIAENGVVGPAPGPRCRRATASRRPAAVGERSAARGSALLDDRAGGRGPAAGVQASARRTSRRPAR